MYGYIFFRSDPNETKVAFVWMHMFDFQMHAISAIQVHCSCSILWGTNLQVKLKLYNGVAFRTRNTTVLLISESRVLVIKTRCPFCVASADLEKGKPTEWAGLYICDTFIFSTFTIPQTSTKFIHAHTFAVLLNWVVICYTNYMQVDYLDFAGT